MELNLLVEDANHTAYVYLVLDLDLPGNVGLGVQDVGDLSLEGLVAVLELLSDLAHTAVKVPLELFSQLPTNVYFVIRSVHSLDIG